MEIRNIVTFSLTPNKKKTNRVSMSQPKIRKTNASMEDVKSIYSIIKYCWIVNSDCYTTRCKNETFRILMYIRG